MQRTLLALLCITLGGIPVFCQVPGYLGKRLSIQAEFHSMPALNGPTANNRGLQTHYGDKGGGFALNWNAGLRAGYVTSRSNQVLASLDYFKTGMIQDAYSPSSSFGSPEYDSHALFYNITGITGGIGTRGFATEKGALAPMGRYSGFSLNATFLRGDILDKRTSYSDPFSESHAPLGIDAKALLFSLGFETGVNFVVKDRLLLNVGAKFNLPLSPRVYRYAFGEEYDWYPYNPDTDYTFAEGNTENFKTLATTRAALHNLVMLYIGVGLLP
ncbi:MAG: hypothetical protein SFV22_19405 [Saprospiraceae bacterium]|nr:hypothetical protein [Saprospiraceae bacterium]